MIRWNVVGVVALMFFCAAVGVLGAALGAAARDDEGDDQ
jgi:hypothetical protein